MRRESRCRCAGVALLLLIAPVRGQQPLPGASGTSPFVSVSAPLIALTHVRLVDGTGAAVRPDQTIVIDGGRIGATGPFASTTIPAGARVLDLSNHTVLPGSPGSSVFTSTRISEAWRASRR
jgi:hypothetical protein